MVRASKQPKRRGRFKLGRKNLDFLRAFNTFTPEQRLIWSYMTSYLMLMASPELLKERARAARDPSLPFPKTTWVPRMKKTSSGRRLELIEVTERDTRPGWRW